MNSWPRLLRPGFAPVNPLPLQRQNPESGKAGADENYPAVVASRRR